MELDNVAIALMQAATQAITSNDGVHVVAVVFNVEDDRVAVVSTTELTRSIVGAISHTLIMASTKPSGEQNVH